MKRFKRRSAAILALAVAGAVAVAGVALASGESTVTVNFTPSALPPPGTGYTSGKLNVHTHTAYTNPGNANPGGATDRAQLYFDDDFRLNTNAVPKCRTSQLSGNITMKTAMARCGPSRVSTSTAPLSTAQASVDGLFNVNGCVLVFNGASSTGEALLFMRVNVADPPNNNITCGSPASNEQGNTSILLKGDLKANPSPQGADFADPDNCSAPIRNGCQLDINNITDSADLPLTDFNAYVQKGSFIAGRCDDTLKALNLKVKFTYNNGTFDNRSTSKACT